VSVSTWSVCSASVAGWCMRRDSSSSRARCLQPPINKPYHCNSWLRAMGITQCYLPPNTSECAPRSALTPVSKLVLWFTDPRGMECWVNLGYPAMHQPEVELTISWSEVQRRNHYTTEPLTVLTLNVNDGRHRRRVRILGGHYKTSASVAKLFNCYPWTANIQHYAELGVFNQQ